MNKIEIVLAFDNNYIKPASALIASILKNAKPTTDIGINILCTNISEEEKYCIRGLNSTNPNCHFLFVDMDKYLKDVNLDKFMSVRDDYQYISTATYYRFFLTDIFKKLDKVLYLDIDMIVQDDLFELFNTDISNYYIGAVDDWFIKDHLKNNHLSPYNGMTFNDYFKKKLKKKNEKYFNAGTILFNLDRIMKDNVDKKLWEFATKESPLVFQDQDIMNAVMEGEIKYVDGKYNVFPQFSDKIKQISIIHYVGGIKPHNKETGIGLWDKYWEYFKLTPFFCDEDNCFLEMVNSNRAESIKNIEIFGKRIAKIKYYADKIKVRLFDRVFYIEKNAFKKHFKKINAQQKIDDVAYKYWGKKIVLYGAGQYANVLFENYDLSRLNIVAIADRKFEDEGKRSFHGLNCIAPVQLRNIDCDVILVSNSRFDMFLDYIEDSILEGSKNENIEIRKLV